MQQHIHALTHSPLGTTRSVHALHFGDAASARKIYIQASLHADELPGSLVAYHLRELLTELEAQGRMAAQIILVPLCNPIGLAQTVLYEASSRFDLFTGRNFNRLTDFSLYGATRDYLLAHQIALGSDASANVAAIRHAMGEVLKAYQPANAVDELQHVLVSMAYDADVVIDLHCDMSAVMHLYTLPQLWPRLEPLARFVGSACQILSEDSGSNAFDEFLSTPWLKLSRDFAQANIPCACASTTLELRGQADLSHELARADAQGIVNYLMHQGDIRAESAPELPALIRAPHPLAGLAYVLAPHSGVAVLLVQAGDSVTEGQEVAQIVDPIHLTIHPVHSPTDGFVYATHRTHFAQHGATLVSVSGERDLGLGESLGP